MFMSASSSNRFEDIDSISQALGAKIQNLSLGEDVVQNILQEFNLQSMYLTEDQIGQIAAAVDAIGEDGDLGEETPRAALGHLLAQEIQSYAPIDRDDLQERAKQNFKDYLTRTWENLGDVIKDDVLDEKRFSEAYADMAVSAVLAAAPARPVLTPGPGSDPLASPPPPPPPPASPGASLKGKAVLRPAGCGV
jgi:hypothetical protein